MRDIIVKGVRFPCKATHPLIADDVQSYRIVFTPGGDISDAMFQVTATREDGVKVEDLGEIVENVAYYTIKNNMYSVAGVTAFRLAILKDGMKLTDAELQCDVWGATGDADVSGDDRLPILTSALLLTQEMGEYAQAQGDYAQAQGDYAKGVGEGYAEALTEGLAGKEPTIPPSTADTYLRGDKAWTNFAANVRGTVLTGVTFLTNAAVLATDTLLVAIGNYRHRSVTKSTRMVLRCCRTPTSRRRKKRSSQGLPTTQIISLTPIRQPTTPQS